MDRNIPKRTVLALKGRGDESISHGLKVVWRKGVFREDMEVGYYGPCHVRLITISGPVILNEQGDSRIVLSG